MYLNNNELIKVNARSLYFVYQPITTSATYDICDLGGNILKSGTLINGLSCDISKFSMGVYMLYIIDSGKVLKERFII